MSDRPRGTLSHAWRALRHRNFKLFFVGQSISLLGNWMTRLATTWLVYRVTHSALLLGLVTFAGQIVSFALGPFAGVWVERLNRRRLLVWTQAAQVLHGGAATLGWLTGASGIGALISALSLAVRKSVVGLAGMLQIAAATLGAALILFGLSHTLWISLALMVFAGFGLMQGASASNTIIQSLVPEDKRARAMSYYTMAFFGAAPFGSLLAGALAGRIGAPLTVILTGACCIAGSIWFTLERTTLNELV